MPVVRIDALCECEGCAKQFGIEIDLDWKLNDHEYGFEDFEALVRETIQNGLNPGYRWGVRAKSTVDRFPIDGHVTVQGGRILCDDCTRKCDALPIERNLTDQEVNQVLGLDAQ